MLKILQEFAYLYAITQMHSLLFLCIVAFMYINITLIKVLLYDDKKSYQLMICAFIMSIIPILNIIICSEIYLFYQARSGWYFKDIHLYYS